MREAQRTQFEGDSSCIFSVAEAEEGVLKTGFVDFALESFSVGRGLEAACLLEEVVIEIAFEH